MPKQQLLHKKRMVAGSPHLDNFTGLLSGVAADVRDVDTKLALPPEFDTVAVRKAISAILSGLVDELHRIKKTSRQEYVEQDD
jgi:hypothetical protein